MSARLAPQLVPRTGDRFWPYARARGPDLPRGKGGEPPEPAPPPEGAPLRRPPPSGVQNERDRVAVLAVSQVTDSWFVEDPVIVPTHPDDDIPYAVGDLLLTFTNDWSPRTATS